MNRKTCSQMKAFNMSVFFLFPVERMQTSRKYITAQAASRITLFVHHVLADDAELYFLSVHMHTSTIYIDVLIRTINDQHIEYRMENELIVIFLNQMHCQ